MPHIRKRRSGRSVGGGRGDFGPHVYNSFSAEEKAMWHYHKAEIPKVAASLPEISGEEAAKIVKSMEETHGKVYLL